MAKCLRCLNWKPPAVAFVVALAVVALVVVKCLWSQHQTRIDSRSRIRRCHQAVLDCLWQTLAGALGTFAAVVVGLRGQKN